MPTHIYHITHIDNLAGIIAKGGVFAQTQMENNSIDYTNIAHDRIQDRRLTTPVPCDPGGYLHDYIPFYFAVRSPMLYAIKMGNVEGYSAGQTDIIYLVSSAEIIKAAKIGFVFTDGHGIMALSEFYDDLSKLTEIDWDIMKEKYWRDTYEDPDRKRRRQAEFLVYNKFSWDLVEEIGVMNKRMQLKTADTISIASHKPPINLKPDWYY